MVGKAHGGLRTSLAGAVSPLLAVRRHCSLPPLLLLLLLMLADGQ